jgi:putative transposase
VFVNPEVARPPSQRSLDDDVVAAKLYASFKASDRIYGARRVWRDVLADGVSCALHRIERLMRSQALRARPSRRGLPKDDGARLTSVIAPNVLDRQFTATRRSSS